MKKIKNLLSEKNIKNLTVVLLLLALLLGEAAVASYVSDQRTAVGVGGKTLDTAARLTELMMESAVQVQENAPLLEKNYALERHTTKGPKADESCFGSTDDPAVVQAVVEQAADLLDGQTLSWNPDLERKPGSEIQYYLDESILAIVWQEVWDHAVVTFAEIKLADATQMVRRVAQDEVGSHKWQTPTTMAEQANAVVAISADFYLFRGIGLSVYQGEIYRNEPAYLDHCFIDYSGNMITTKRNELSKADSQQFIADNDVNFSLAFGPVLVQNGEKQKVTQYSLGEVHDEYSRAAIGQVDDLHYILMTLNSELYYYNTGVIRDSIEIMYEKNCKEAYALDGGRTASLVFNGALVNTVNYGGERTMSDIIAFVSAVPEDEQ